MEFDPRSGSLPHRRCAGRYLLGDVLGRGAMAEVVRAHDELLGREVAVKIFRHGLSDPERIEAEKRTLASLSHPGLVTLYDAGTADDGDLAAPYLVMELVDGPTLGAFRAGGTLTPAMTARIGSELAESLAYIHGRGVLHRDIKPANVLIADPTGPGQRQFTKLTDFGIARIVDEERLTEHGTTVGTAHYLSPEQATGNVTGPATDVYTLGLVLIEALTGRMAFEGSAVAAAVARLHRDPEVPDDFGPQWSSLLADMTTRDPDRRPTAAELVPRLRVLTSDRSPAGSVLPQPTATLPVRADTAPVHQSATVSPRSRWWAVSGAAAVAVLFATTVGWSLIGGSEDDVTDPTPVPITEVFSGGGDVSVTPAPSTVPAPVVPVEQAPEPTPIPVEAVPAARAPLSDGTPGSNGGPGSNSGRGANSGPGSNGGPGSNSGRGANSGPGSNAGGASGNAGSGNAGSGNAGSGNSGRGN